MKVEIVSHNNVKEFVNYVNKFITTKKVIDIKYSSFVVPSKNGQKFEVYDRALIMYEDLV